MKQRSLPFFKILISSRNRKKLLQKFPPFVTNDLIDLLVKKKKKIPSKYHGQIKKLGKIRGKKKQRVFVYKQRGAFLTSILPLVASLIGGIVANVSK